MNYYPNYCTRRLYFGEVETPYSTSSFICVDNVVFDDLQLNDLTTLDLSKNKLEQVPATLENAKSLLVLNLSENR